MTGWRRDREVCVMQNAETVLAVLRERGRRNLPCNELYRQLFNPQLYLMAYGRIYSNQGAMTAGATGETADGMSMEKIGRIIDALRHERYRFDPVRRVHIPKKNGKTRPLGLPSWSDKLVGEVMRLLLEAYYEPTFSDRSHGFRPRRGCHTALGEVVRTWTGTAWFVEGDIAQCFDRLDHQVMLDTLGEKIRDNRFLRLVRNMLGAGYLEDWKWNTTLSGAPQGGVLSPLLSNIYLHRLDTFIETVLIPEYTRGKLRARNLEYQRVLWALTSARNRKDHAQARKLRQQLHRLPSQDMNDPDYRRLRYVRYADDTLLGFAGPRAEAEQIKQRIATFLRDDLKLELSQEKTLITHARTGKARFLGYDITVRHENRRLKRFATDRRNRRTVNGAIALHVPKDVIKAHSTPYLKGGKPARRPHLTHADDHTIVNLYGARYRGIVQYYLLAGDVFRLNRLHWVMQTSLLHTLANKHRSTVSKTARTYKATIDTPAGRRTCLQVSTERGPGRKPLVARFGGIPLQRQKTAVLLDREPSWASHRRKELIGRFLARWCELCGRPGNVQVHQIRRLADLGKPGEQQPDWAALMIKRRRKTLVVCARCHEDIHAGQPTASHGEDHWRARCG
ncbi:reverse transcriptase domain-containing protein [Streptomyces sp. NBC_00391]